MDQQRAYYSAPRTISSQPMRGNSSKRMIEEGRKKLEGRRFDGGLRKQANAGA
jgi:hypothetical protein